MAGPLRSAIRAGRIVEVAERSYRVRTLDVFDRLGCDRQTTATGRRWVALVERGRLLAGQRAACLEGGSHGVGEMSDDADAAAAEMTAVLRALDRGWWSRAFRLVDDDGRGMDRDTVVALVAAIDRAWP